MPETNPFVGLRNRLLQAIALNAPGAMSVRVRLHRWRGVEIGQNVWIGHQVLLEGSYPELVHIGSNVTISIRATIIAHFREHRGVWIEDDVFVGPCACILPAVRLGKGCVVTAGSVVTSSVAPMTVVQGNPARPVARCGVPMGLQTTTKEFIRSLVPIR
jgi:acetyltransferase-like isoleucine patch superfamily enzyme